MELTKKQIKLYNDQRISKATGAICWAAERSMYIGFRGNITTCCFNKTYLIGKYPDQTIQAIWFGEKRKALHDKLISNELSLGCHGCQELIAAGNYKSTPAKNFDHLPTDSEGYPTKIDFELSNTCNLECVMCRGEFSSAIRKNREGLPPIASPYGADFIQQLEPFIPHLKQCHFLGGEPFMIPIYLEVWDKIAAINPQVEISVQTNATILSERIKRIMGAVSFNISISIDSVVEESYERIRKNANFKKVMDNIKYFKEYTLQKGTSLSFSLCPMPQTWQELPAFVDFANTLDAAVFFNMVDYPKEYSFHSLSKEALIQIKKGLEHQRFEAKTAKQANNAQAFKQVVDHIAYLIETYTETGENQDYQAFLANLHQYIEAENKASNGAVDFEEVKEKLEYLLQVANDHGRRKLAEEKIAQVEYRDLYRSVPGIDNAHLLHLFKAFILPLAD